MPGPIIVPYDYHAASSHREISTIQLGVKSCGEQDETIWGHMNEEPHGGSQQKREIVKS